MLTGKQTSIAAGLTILFLLTAGATRAEEELRKPPRFDHTLYVQIDSEPRGADIYAVSVLSNKVSEKIGVTPCIATIALVWDRHYGRRTWPHVTAWTAGDACRVEYDAKKKTHTLYFSCAAAKSGYHANNVELPIGTLTKPGLAWDTDDWPEEAGIGIELTPKAQHLLPPKNRTKPKSVQKVILASADTGTADLGTIAVRGNQAGTAVFVDKKYAGKLPLDIMIPEGAYKLEVRKKGFLPFAKDIKVHSASRKNVMVELTPAN